MSAATQVLDSQRKEADLGYGLVGANTTIWGGTIVNTRGDGYLYPARAANSGTDTMFGVAYENGPNGAGSAGAIGMRVFKEGSFVFAGTGFTQASVGQPMYALDDSTVTATVGTNVLVGYAVEYISATQIRVRIDRAVQ